MPQVNGRRRLWLYAAIILVFLAIMWLERATEMAKPP
jgi:hypothetical protein